MSSLRGEIKDGIPYVECPLCGRLCEVRKTKKDLPFLQCPYCRTQIFVRDKRGAKLLSRILKKER